MNDDNWKNVHKKYDEKDWSKLPSIFAKEAIHYFPKEGRILELGTGVGQDAIYFSENGYTVTATDLYIETVKKKIKQKGAKNIETKVVDLRQSLSFADESYNIVYAHLSLHYFGHVETQQLFDEIYRVLKSGGTFALFTNSASDPEYGTGTQIDEDYFLIDGVAKRYFSVESLKPYLNKFNPVLIDANGETYKDKAVGVHNLIRAIVTKP